MCLKKISVVTPCYNEEANIAALYEHVKAQFDLLKDKYEYEHIFIDNDSKDASRSILRDLASKDKNVKVIFNLKNFGWSRSPFYALQQAKGDAVIRLACDFQDPPELIPELLKQWEEGHYVVVGIKNKSKENPIMRWVRNGYYNLIRKMSETEHISNFTGFGLYDQQFVDQVLRKIDDPYPYLRGIVAEYSANRGVVYFTQPKRKGGKSSSNFYKLYDFAMLGFVNHTKVPLRLATFIGFTVAVVSFLVALFYLIYKLVYWDSFELGLAPMVVGIFFFFSVQLIFTGILGEYIGAIFTEVRKRPLVIEKERINF
jgi:glycosyltransferase involved in cell wall biosynthesis